MPGKVYLSGPIAGLSYVGATSWRAMAAKAFDQHGITALDPMRGKEVLRGVSKLTPFSDSDNPMCKPRGIMTRDRFDCLRADVCLVNLQQAPEIEHLSLGTIMEVAWADAARIPVVCVRDPGTYNHPMFNEAVGFETDNIFEALDIIIDMLR